MRRRLLAAMALAPAILLAAALLLAAAPLPAAAPAADEPTSTRPPAGYEALRDELRASAETLRAAFRDALPGLPVVDVETGYLADQGVLMIIDVASPWLHVDGGDIAIDPVVTSLEQIPDMVHGILRELDLGLSASQTEELQELRGLRDVQKQLRAERRNLRAQLREQRRERQRADAAEATAVLDERIAVLEAQLDGVQREARRLAREAETRRETLDAPVSRRAAPPPGRRDLDRAVAETLCEHADAFAAVPSGSSLNVLVRQRRVTRYYVFDMGAVRGCEDNGPGVLLREGFRYES